MNRLANVSLIAFFLVAISLPGCLAFVQAPLNYGLAVAQSDKNWVETQKTRLMEWFGQNLGFRAQLASIATFCETVLLGNKPDLPAAGLVPQAEGKN